MNFGQYRSPGGQISFHVDAEFYWMPLTLPPELSLHAATSLEIIYAPSGTFIIQGHNPGMRIRIAEAPDSETVHAEIFSQLVGRRSPAAR
jgi:hypothetical protein